MKLLRFQRTFHEKSFVSGFGAKAPTDNAHKKSTATPCFLIIVICWNCRSKPCFKGLFVKSPLKIRKNFPPNTPICFGEAFEIPKDFSRKVLCVGVPRRKPQLIMPTKNAEKSAFFLYLRKNIFCS